MAACSERCIVVGENPSSRQAFASSGSAAVALRRFDVARRMARFYAVSIQPTLFGDYAVIRRWGRINTDGGRSETWHTSEACALLQAAQQVAAKQRRGYREVTG